MKFQIGKHECSVRIEDSYKSFSRVTHTRHCNAEHELFILLEGSCTFEVEDACYEMKRADGLLVFPSRFHCPLELSEDAALLALPFTVEGNPFGADKDCMLLSLPSFVYEASKQFLLELENDALFGREVARSCCKILLTEAFRLAACGGETEKEEEEQKTKTRHRIDLIDQFFDQPFSPETGEEGLAEMLHLSRRQLNRILKSHYGMCFREKLLRSKMDRAAFLLRKTQASISNISEEVGYLSVTAFFKAFKAYHGISPKRYRESYFKENAHKALL